MDCKLSDVLFMKYMDNTLSEEENVKLNEHIKVCDMCKHEFSIYDMIVEEFSFTELVSAPDNFEDEVMNKIYTLEPIYLKLNNQIDNIFLYVWSAISILLGVGFMLVSGKNNVLSYLQTKPNLNNFMVTFEAITNFITVNTQNLISSFSVRMVDYTSLILDFKYYTLAILFIVAYALYFNNLKQTSQ